MAECSAPLDAPDPDPDPDTIIEHLASDFFNASQAERNEYANAVLA